MSVMNSHFEMADAGGDGRVRREAFAVASRHSQRVRRLKIGIIAGCTIGILGLAAITIFDPFRTTSANVSVGEVKLSGTRVTMDLPKLAGFRRDGRPYKVLAQSAVQDFKRPNILELTDIDADIGMGDSGNAKVTAKTGVYDSGKEFMSLKTDVRVKTDTGYDVTLASAEVDFKTGMVVSNEPVTVLMTTGTINSDRMLILDNGKQMTFEGNVHTFFKAAESQQGAAKDLKGTNQ